MSDDRNFRYGYYEKVGFRGVEEKKSLDILLKEKPTDFLAKLSYFASRFPLPGMYRMTVWKFLLGITHPNCENDTFIIDEQLALCHDLKRALHFMMYCDDTTPHNKFILMMFFLEQGDLDDDFDKQLLKDEVMDLFTVADILSKEFISDRMEHSFEYTYWLFKNLISSIRLNMDLLVKTCCKFINEKIKEEDQVLYNHLMKTKVIVVVSTDKLNEHCDYKKYKNLPLRPFFTWFIRFYAGIIHEQFLIKIFDRVVGTLNHGTKSFAILSLVGKGILALKKDEILSLSNANEIIKCLLTPLTVKQSEEIITQAFVIT